ncbi:type IX secretion system membrane protein PorP/SprF [Aquimarina sp. MMG016]|uniref:PorP/SprF family type IX secretion system membrane protein n=1 Tax=Aquimarina sp. MMG016 TaxID=2822690 RepID=UPI001B3A4CE7|nr:type IX secretion system membrane protein PorP/SprF [Aquimarina sp. MMG016]MBQ4818592.1 type IX secretion system membrane protein PorP/SprF [Aquimarina sp. MMG016]
MKFLTGIFKVWVVLCWGVTTAQEGLPIYSDYLTDNYYLLHPSMAGVANCSQIRLTARKNWLGQGESPGLGTINYNGRVGDQSGIGVIVYQDKNGYYSQTGGYLTYAHHLMFSRSEADLNMLSFGLSAGLIQYRHDQSSFVADGDLLVSGFTLSSSNFNIDFGFSYHLYNFYAHVTAKNILENSGVNKDLQITSNLRNYLVSIGYEISKRNSDWTFEPSVLYSYRDGIKQSSIDFNIKAYHDMDFGKLWGGLSYRRSLDAVETFDGTDFKSQSLNYITPFIGVNFKKLLIAYTYSYQSNDVVFNNGGFHQITLGLDFSCRPKRYACYCPAVN